MSELVHIVWKNPDNDWNYFWLLKETKNKLYLQGADSPEGDRHDGDKFWINTSDIRALKVIRKEKKRTPQQIIRDILLVAEGGTTWGPGLLLSAEESAIAIRYLIRKVNRLEKGKKK
jgi:hypothetical protein